MMLFHQSHVAGKNCELKKSMGSVKEHFSTREGEICSGKRGLQVTLGISDTSGQGLWPPADVREPLLFSVKGLKATGKVCLGWGKEFDTELTLSNRKVDTRDIGCVSAISCKICMLSLPWSLIWRAHCTWFGTASTGMSMHPQVNEKSKVKLLMNNMEKT